MDPRAVEQAKEKIARAEKALAELNSATDFKPVEAAWTDFLLAASGVYSKLQQGSKVSGQSKAWFGRKIADRKDDPLMRYLHQARNSDEHGIERVVDRGGNKVGLDGRPLKFGERIPVRIQALDENDQPINHPDAIDDAFLEGPSLRLVTVHDRRYNNHCDPPTHHLGKPIAPKDNYLSGLGLLAVAYLKALVEEAENLGTAPVQ